MGVYIRAVCCAKGCDIINQGDCVDTPRYAVASATFSIPLLDNFSIQYLASGGGTMRYGSDSYPSTVTIGPTTGIFSGYFSGLERTEVITIYASNACGAGFLKYEIDVTAQGGGGGCAFYGGNGAGPNPLADPGTCLDDTYDVTGQFSSAANITVNVLVNQGSARALLYANGSLIFTSSCYDDQGTGWQSNTVNIPSGTNTIRIVITCDCLGNDVGSWIWYFMQCA